MESTLNLSPRHPICVAIALLCAMCAGCNAGDDTSLADQIEGQQIIPDAAPIMWQHNCRDWVDWQGNDAIKKMQACRAAIDFCIDEGVKGIPVQTLGRRPNEPGDRNRPLIQVDAFSNPVRDNLATQCAEKITPEMIGSLNSTARGSLTSFRFLATGTTYDDDAVLACQAIEFTNGLNLIEYHDPDNKKQGGEPRPSLGVRCYECNQRQIWQSATQNDRSTLKAMIIGPAQSVRVAEWYRTIIQQNYGTYRLNHMVSEGPHSYDYLMMEPYKNANPSEIFESRSLLPPQR